jgi:hypothetical protein
MQLITKVEHRCAWINHGWVTTQMTSLLGDVVFIFCILRTGKASEKTSRGVILPVCVKYCKTPKEKGKNCFFCKTYKIPLEARLQTLMCLLSIKWTTNLE